MPEEYLFRDNSKKRHALTLSLQAADDVFEVRDEPTRSTLDHTGSSRTANFQAAAPGVGTPFTLLAVISIRAGQ
jgi:hypothetical protein